jgi:uncharacterized membrane protein YbhN (UPF0104 family)
LASAAAIGIKRRAPGRYWPVAARAAVSVLLLVWVFSNFHWAALSTQLRAASPVWLAAAWLLLGVPIGLIAVRWRWLLRVQGLRLGLGKVFAITCVGQFFNSFLLGATGGDVMRVAYVMREVPEAKTRAAVSILVDRAMGLAVLAILALLAASTEWRWLMSRGDLRRVAWVLVTIVALSVVGVASLAWVPLPAICAHLGMPSRPAAVVTAVYSAASEYLHAPAATASAAALTVAVHLANMAGGYCLARALSLPVGFASMGVILAIVFFVIAVPVTASGHGLRESIFVLMFSLFGVDSSAALVYSMCYLGFTLGWSAACAPAYLAFRGRTVAKPFSR